MILVDTVFKLEKVEKDILNAEILGVDIETYDYRGKDFGKTRLVQIAVKDEVFVFDLMKIHFPPYLKQVFQDGKKVKIFHNGFYDMSYLIKEFDCKFENTFCTMNATKVLSCGLNVKYSLKSVAKTFLGEEIDKKEQTSDWGGELTQSQIAYASKDASILLKLYETQTKYLKAKKLNKIARLENAMQRIDAYNFAKRFFPEKNLIEEKLSDIEKNVFAGIKPEEIEKAKKLPETINREKEHYIFLKKIKEKGFYPEFRTNWKTNGFFFQKNYSENLKEVFPDITEVCFFHLQLPAIHSNARDFKSAELYSNKEFFKTREFILLKGIALKDFDLISEYLYLVNDFKKNIPGIIRWHKKMFGLLAEKKPVRLASGKLIHTKNFNIEEDREGFISFLIKAHISDFYKTFIVLAEKEGFRVLQADTNRGKIHLLNGNREKIEEIISITSQFTFGKPIPPHFYKIT